MAEDLRADIAAARAKTKNLVGGGREIKKLESHLWDGETVEQLATGTYGKGQGLLALTSQRVLFTLEGMMNTQSEDFPLNQISSVQWNSGMIMGSIVIFASGNKAEVKNVDKVSGKALVDAIRGRLQTRAAGAESVPPAAAPPAAEAALDIPDQIRKLKDLHTQGILDDAEFNAKKAELLARM